MNGLNQITHWFSIIVLFNLGIEGIFDINLLDKLFVNHRLVHQLLQISCLFAGAWMMLQNPSQ